MSEGNGKTLPKGWSNAGLSDLVGPRIGKVNPQQIPDAKYIGMEQVEPHTMRLLGTVPAGTMKSAANVMRPFDVLYGRLRAYLNKVYQPEFDGLCSGEFIVLPQTAAMHGRFLKYRLNAADFVRFASHINTGDRPRVDWDQIKIFVVRLPPQAEQIRIADTLDELLSDLEAGVKALEGVRAKLKQYRAAVLKAAVDGTLTAEWRKAHPETEPARELLKRILAERRRRWEEAQLKKFKDAGKERPDGWREKYKVPVGPATAGLPSLPKHWSWVSIDQIADVQGGLQKSPTRAPKRHHFPYLRVANVLRGSLNLMELHRFELTDDELDRLRLETGDLLVVEGNGSRTEIGRAAVWRGEVANCVHQNHIIRARPILGLVANYLGQYFNSPIGQFAIQLVASSTSGLYTLSISKIERLALALPPTDEQNAIVELTEAQLSVIDQLESDLDAKLKSAAALRQSILKCAFEGRLVPQDPSDEPAGELLKRIAAERAERERLARAAKEAVKKTAKPASRRTNGESKRRRTGVD